MNLSKAFDTINHQLLLIKLYDYGFSNQALTINFCYLSNKKKKDKNKYSFQFLEEFNISCGSRIRRWTFALQSLPG